jgi:dolichyl-phosphate beta-glucosyltransferase
LKIQEKRVPSDDTQCDLKFMRADMLKPVNPQLQEDHWMLDLELILRIKQQGARFQEVPIDWIDTADSHVRFGIDAFRMLLALMRLKGRQDS